MIVGLDFGTTNSGMSVFDGSQLNLLPIDPTNGNPRIVRTALYFSKSQQTLIGRHAINSYFEQNVGRAVKMQKIRVGEVEYRGADMHYVADVYAMVDVLAPGRLFLSIKSGLHDPEYQGTVFGEHYYSLEDLIAIFLKIAKLRAERLLDNQIDEVVLGRPVRFSHEADADQLAQQRLLRAAFQSGYKRVFLEYEPIAAAYFYVAIVDKPQNILIFDFGGGTLDITVMRVKDRQDRTVLATGGIPVAGDVFDQRIVRAKLPRHFGEGSLFVSGDKNLPVPKWIFEVFSDWQSNAELQTSESQRVLDQISRTSNDRKGIEALISLVSNNYSLYMFDVVEKAKRELSSRQRTEICLGGPKFDITEAVTRQEFEQIIAHEIRAIGRELDNTIKASGLSRDQIDAVIRTGGSSEIPAFHNILVERFGPERVKSVDTFSSVASGLGIIAHGVSSGDIELQSYTSDSLERISQVNSQQVVKSASWDLVQGRLEMQEEMDDSTAEEDLHFILLLYPKGSLRTVQLQRSQSYEDLPTIIEQSSLERSLVPQTALAISANQSVLIVTSMYRFLLLTAAELLEHQQFGLDVESYYSFKSGEYIAAVSNWFELKQYSKLVLVTTEGFLRTYELSRIAGDIEAPLPFRLEGQLPGVPARVFGAYSEDDIVLVLDNGRAARYPVDQLPLRGLRAIRTGRGERVFAIRSVEEGDEVMVVAADGFGTRLSTQSIPITDKKNIPGRVVLSRRIVRGIYRMAKEMQTWIVTSCQVLAMDDISNSLDTTSTSARSLVDIEQNEEVLVLIEN